jgi:hypothetical protein
MQPLIDWAREWKELAGALVGGLFALGVALLVARQARRAEERASAMLLIGELQRIVAMVENAASSAQKKEIPPADHSLFVAQLYATYRVRLSPLADAAMSRVMLCDVHLAACLTIVFSFIRDTEPAILRLEADSAAASRKESSQRSEADIQTDINVVTTSYRKTGLFARSAVRLLEQQALGQFPTWHKVRRRVFPNAWEKEYFQLAERGDA